MEQGSDQIYFLDQIWEFFFYPTLYSNDIKMKMLEIISPCDLSSILLEKFLT